MSREFLKALLPLLSFSRARGYKHPGGLRYPGGITYYPRFPDHKDPEYTPSKLFRIERIKPVKGQPWWLRKILREFHIEEEDAEQFGWIRIRHGTKGDKLATPHLGTEKVAIVKNIPEINARLWKVKHLIRVTPIVFPYGEPTEEDINYTVLKENGQCLVTKKLDVDIKSIEALAQFESNPKRMDSDTLKKDSRNKWMSGWGGGY